MKRIVFLLLVALLLACFAAAGADELRVDFYDMGKADAMLITTPQGERLLIDAGTNKDGKQLVKQFEQEGIGRIDTFIVTHYDKDHVGGADRILEELPVGTVVMPVYEKESKQHTQFVEALDALEGVNIVPMEILSDLALEYAGGVKLHITAAHRSSYGSDEENDFSLAVRLTYGETKFLFAGDAEALRQQELLEEGDVACDVLKVPYHGRLVSTSEQFLKAASPQIAYITDEEEDPASGELIRILESLGAQVYRSRDDGDVTVISDGRSVKAL